MDTYIMDPTRITTIPEFYEALADAMYDKSFDHYDCTKVEVGESIFEDIRAYYKEQGVDDFNFNMLWVCYGPKATLKGYEVQAEDGWAYNDKEE